MPLTIPKHSKSAYPYDPVGMLGRTSTMPTRNILPGNTNRFERDVEAANLAAFLASVHHDCPTETQIREESIERENALVASLWRSTVGCLEEHQSLMEQIDRVGELQRNWNGYGAEEIHLNIILAAKLFIAALPRPLLQLPQVVPMTHGRLQFEWHAGPRSLELEFESPLRIHYLKWDSSRNIEDEDSLPVSDQRQILDLIGWFQAGV